MVGIDSAESLVQILLPQKTCFVEGLMLGKSMKAQSPHVNAMGRVECHSSGSHRQSSGVVAVAEWYRYRTVACFVTCSSPVPLKTRRVGQRYTLNLSRAETSSRWCGVVVRRGGASSGVDHVT
ncbi:uncharacterized protein TNCV_1448531 [Trichonephila clavipes]|nr:uncharacterized protein TNCV_1448531 [Trichonephila clavipes]